MTQLHDETQHDLRAQSEAEVKAAFAENLTAPSASVPLEFRLKENFVPKQRYISEEFAQLEDELLWPRVWQAACRVEELSKPGDFIEYEFGKQSILLVRVDGETIKAYFNACRHRGTRLARGCGQLGPAGIRCPFHGWRWNANGENTYVARREEFTPEALSPENLRLRELRIDQWAGWVFVNPDPGARPLAEALAPMPDFLDALGLDRMRVLWWKTTRLPANWKTAMEAFLEAYHIPATHPQLPVLGGSDENLEYFVHENGHSRYGAGFRDGVVGRPSKPSAAAGFDDDDFDERQVFVSAITNSADQLGGTVNQREKYIAAQLRRREVPEGSTVGQQFAELMFSYAEAAGIPLPRVTPEQAREYGTVAYMFPNLMFLPNIGNVLMYRVRPVPGEPDACYWEIVAATLFSEDEQPPTIAKREVHHLDREAVGEIPFQDFSNMQSITTGLHSSGYEGSSLNARQEQGILNMHREIDRYLFGGGH